MTTTTISQLKLNPSAVIAQAVDYPVAVANRSTIEAYVVGRSLFEKLLAYVEDRVDRAAVTQADFTDKKDFEEVARELGI
ncbi:hypothetical protein HY949_02115 [Candidatus Gottesmanbacteria bacterium]|nr:hypothetical protein [Candidatus Gottesmanbacteria bacterium]